MHRTIAAAFMAAMAAAPASAQTAAASPLALPSVEWAHRWQSKDLDAVLALYTNDAVFVERRRIACYGEAGAAEILRKRSRAIQRATVSPQCQQCELRRPWL